MTDMERENQPPPLPGRKAEKKRGKNLTWFENWRNVAFANSAIRREAKALLFKELALAAQFNMPLHEALEGCLRTDNERRTETEPSLRSTILDKLLFLVMFFFLLGGGLYLLALTSMWSADTERVARVLARRLLPLAQAGHSLSDAMAAQGSDYTEQEIAAVRAGETWGTLPAALENLGAYQLYERDLQRHWAPMAFPLVLGGMMIGIGSFIIIFIVPKLKDIYDQLGAELPGPTQLLIDGGYMILSGLSGTVLFLPSQAFLFLLFIFIVRRYMVGSLFLRNLLLIIPLAGACFMMTLGLTEHVPTEFGIYIIPAFVVMVLISFAAAMLILGLLEQLVLAVERGFFRLLGALPIIGAPKRTEQESRWLGALSMALSSGVDTAGAVESAGNISGGGMMKSSARAAAMVRQGHSIGDAVTRSRVLRARYAHRMRLLDGRDTYLDGLADIAEDASRDTYHTMNRTARVCEVATVCLMAIVIFFIVVAVYLPLFRITHTISTGY